MTPFFPIFCSRCVGDRYHIKESSSRGGSMGRQFKPQTDRQTHTHTHTRKRWLEKRFKECLVPLTDQQQ